LAWAEKEVFAMLFEDRMDAGRQLARKLEHYRHEDAIVIALPRGGVPVGYEIAQRLQVPLDVMVVRKLGAPQQPELGIGAIAPGNVRVLNPEIIQILGTSQADIDEIAHREKLEMARRLTAYRGDRPMPDLRDRIVILVDDGLATGVSARAAIRAIRKMEPRKLVLAVPVAAYETYQLLQEEVDEIVCLQIPGDFSAVARWYRDFTQTSDSEVIELLEQARVFSEKGAPSRAPR
jgi:putative phosphoribosyl transferase